MTTYRFTHPVVLLGNRRSAGVRELRPLYLELHTWTKHKLAEKYHLRASKLVTFRLARAVWDEGGITRRIGTAVLHSTAS